MIIVYMQILICSVIMQYIYTHTHNHIASRGLKSLGPTHRP